MTGSFGADVDLPGLRRPDQTTVRGLRLETPIALRALGVRQRGTTIAGAKGARPTVGTPDIDPETIDFGRLEGRGGAGLEPVGPFETEFGARTARMVDPLAAERFRAAREVGRAGARMDPSLNVQTTEEIIGEARAVPEAQVGELADTLRDLDAEIFGSASVRAQVEGARQPRDVDIVVDDKAEATRRLGEALEGANADVQDVFDIKTPADKPRPGDIVKLGEVAPERLETEGGVAVSPASEEILKKAGASLFLRGRGFPEAGPGTRADIDIGPEPVGPPTPGGDLKPARAKDPGDVAAIGRELFGDTPEGLARFNPLARFRRARGRSATTTFEDLFRGDIEASEAAVAGIGDTDALEFDLTRPDIDAARFLADTRGRADVNVLAPRRRRLRDDDAVGRTPDGDDTDIETTRRSRSPADADGERAVTVSSPTPSPTPGSAIGASPYGASADAGQPSPIASPGRADSPPIAAPSPVDIVAEGIPAASYDLGMARDIPTTFITTDLEQTATVTTPVSGTVTANPGTTAVANISLDIEANEKKRDPLTLFTEQQFVADIGTAEAFIGEAGDRDDFNYGI